MKEKNSTKGGLSYFDAGREITFTRGKDFCLPSPWNFILPFPIRLAADRSNSYGFTMPSIDQCRRIREILVARGIRQYSTFNGYIEEQGWQDLAAAGWEEQQKLSKG